MAEVVDVKIEASGVTLPGTIVIPQGATGIVVFAHGSGSSRFSPRNRFVANEMNEGGLATLLFDLLTPKEEAIDNRTAELRFNIPFLAQRVVEVTNWLSNQQHIKDLNIGYFGASTGGGAALVAAAMDKSSKVKAVVSRGGRPDLAGSSLPNVKTPTLLLVGGHDTVVIDLNQRALAKLGSDDKELKIIPAATHLFEETGALEEVARMARDFFKKYL